MPSRFTAEKIAAAIEALSQLRDQQVTLARAWASAAPKLGFWGLGLLAGFVYGGAEGAAAL